LRKTEFRSLKIEFSRDGRSYHVTRTARKWIKKCLKWCFLKILIKL